MKSEKLYDVWTPSFLLSEDFINSIKMMDLSNNHNFYNLRQNEGVMSYVIANTKLSNEIIRCLITDGYCGWHTDPIIPDYTYLLVLRNDVDGFVQLRGISPIIKQSIGTIIGFNNKHYHCQSSKLKTKQEKGIVIYAWFDSNEILSREDVEQQFMSIFDGVIQ